MKKGLNPKLDVGDRIILVHMDGEDVGPGTKGEVIKIEKIPSFGSSVDYQYRVNWFDDGGKVISTLSLLPDVDGWLLDEEKKDIQEIERLEKIFDSVLLKKTKLKDEDLLKHKHSKSEWYITPKEALKYGIVDEILGEVPILKKTRAKKAS